MRPVSEAAVPCRRCKGLTKGASCRAIRAPPPGSAARLEWSADRQRRRRPARACPWEGACSARSRSGLLRSSARSRGLGTRLGKARGSAPTAATIRRRRNPAAATPSRSDQSRPAGQHLQRAQPGQELVRAALRRPCSTAPGQWPERENPDCPKRMGQAGASEQRSGAP